MMMDNRQISLEGMRRIVRIGAMLMVLILLMITPYAIAETAEETPAEEFTYSVLNGTFCSVTGYTGERSEIVIPGVIDGYIVQSLEESAFAANTALTIITLPDSIETIGSGVFKNCTNLRTAVLGTGVTIVSDNAFNGCTSLTEIKFATGLTKIGKSAFAGCTSLTSIQLPETLTTIHSYAFQNCTGLTAVQLPDSVSTLAARAFNNCTNLSSVNYPTGWTATPNANDNSTTSYWESHEGYTSPFEGCSALTSMTIPEGVSAIPKHAFRNVSSLTSVKLPESLTGIGVYAFHNADGLSSITLPDGLTTIGNCAFAENGSLTSMKTGSGLTSVGEYVYQNCTSLTSADMSGSVSLATLTKGMFSGCTALADVKLPSELTWIQSYVFEKCTSLTEISLPDGITKLSARAFYNSTSLSSVNYPASWTSTPNANDNSTTSYWESHEGYVSPFEGCSALTSMTIPEGVTAIPKHAFRNQSALSSIELPESLTSIGVYAFSNADGLTAMTLPANVTSIGNDAFSSSDGLKRIDLSATGVTQVEMRTFQNCTGLTTINLPGSLTWIKSYAFEGCTGLEAIRLPDSITKMSARAFNNCTKLSSVNFPAGWTATPNANDNSTTSYWDNHEGYVSPFMGCTSLKNMVVPDGVSAIPKYAFRNQTGLKTVVLPDSVTSIGIYAFSGTTALENLRLWSGVEAIDATCFADTNAGLTIYGEAGSYAETFSAENSFAFKAQDLVLNFATMQLSFVSAGEALPCVSVDVYDMTDGYLQARLIANDEGVATYNEGIVGHRYMLSWYHSDYNFEETSCMVELTKAGFTMESIEAAAAETMEATPAEEFTYSVTSGTNCEITGYTGERSEIVVPEEINGYTVQGLSASAFAGNTAITKVKLPNTLETMGASAFKNCTNLTTFIGGNSLKNIGTEAFRGCAALTEVKLGGSVATVEDNAFNGCTSLKEIKFATGLTKIGKSAFAGCTSLTSIELPETLTTIHSYAFENCTGLTAVHLPDSVTTLAARAFNNCTNLSSVNYPAGWTSTPNANDNSTTSYWESHEGYTSPFEGCSALTSMTIPEGVSAIPKHAFRNVSSLTSIELPESLTGIGVYAFHNADGLSSITLPDGLTTIGNCAFAENGSLSSMKTGSGLTSVGEYVYQNCTSLTSADMSASAGFATLTKGMFSGCTALADVKLPEELTWIQSYVFEKCTSLTEISLPDGITKLSARAFYNSTSLSSVNYPAGWTSTPNANDNSTTSYWESHEGYVSPFEGCSALTGMTIPEGVTAIPKHAFRNQSALSSIELPESLTSIGVYAFSNADGLTAMTLPANVTSIGNDAFSSSDGLKRIDLSATGVTQVEMRTFQNCTGLSSVSLPGSLTWIKSYAFEGCTGLEAIRLPDSITKMSARAFNNCTKLSSVNFPAGWTATPNANDNSTTSYWDNHEGYVSPFTGCTSLKNMVVPDGVSAIPKYAFRNQTGLKTVVLPDSVTSIGIYAFGGTTALENLRLWSGVEAIDATCFADTNAGLTIYGEAGSYAETFSAENSFAFKAQDLVLNFATMRLSFVSDGMVLPGVSVDVYDMTDGYLQARLITNAEGVATYNEGIVGHRYMLSWYHSDYNFEETSCMVELTKAGFAMESIEAAIEETMEATPAEEFTYSVTSGTNCEITGYTGERSEIVIPEEIDGYTVQGLSASTFAGNTAITKVKLPNTLETMGASAFKNCTNLTTFIGGNSLKNIGAEAFRGCAALTDVKLGGSVATVEDNAFNGCTSLTEIKFATGLTKIGKSAFYGCTSLTSIDLPETLTTIHSYAFQNCTGLTAVQLPDSVSTLAARAFNNCTNLSSVNYPTGWASTPNANDNSTTSYWESHEGYTSPFEGCSALTSMTIPEGVSTIPKYAFRNVSSLTSIELPESLTGIGVYAFHNADGLSSITLPDSLTTIGNCAFAENGSLTSMKTGSGLTSVGEYVYQNCTSLTSADMSESAGFATLTKGMFSGCAALADVKLPSELTWIQSYAFEKCTSLTEISLPDGITKLSARAFYNSTSLSSVNYPANWTSTPNANDNSTTSYWESHEGYVSPFEGCSALTGMTIPEGVTAIPKHAFRNQSALSSIELPESLTSIGVYAFSNADGLTAMTLPANVTSIGNDAFSSSDGLKRIDLSATGVTQVEMRTFQNCTGLTTINMPGSLTWIKSYAFEGCTGLEAIRLPDSITKLSARVFNNCTKLSSVNFPAGWTATPNANDNSTTSYWDNHEGYVSPFMGCASLTSMTIPEGITAIPSYAFRQHTALTGVNLPESLTSIGKYAFAGAGLATLDLPDGVSSMGNNAFQNCTGLRNIYLGTLANVPNAAFNGCTGLVSVVLHDDLKGISSQSFANCSNLSAIYIPKGIEAMEADAFSNCAKLTIYCYSGTVAHTVAEANSLPFQLLDEHEHEYEMQVETEANCTRGGSQMMTCTICSYTYIELTEPLGHDEPEEFTVDVEMTCEQDGHQQKVCLRCEEVIAEEIIPAPGHQYGDWTVEKEATLLTTGLRWCICAACEERLEEVIPLLEMTDDIRDQYGLASFHVVNATTGAAISGAQIHVRLSDAEMLTITTGADGRVDQLLPVGTLRASVYASGMMSRSIRINVTSGACTIPDIGLSDMDLVSAELNVTEMTYEEIVDAGIDVTDPSNEHVYKYSVTLEFSPTIDVLNMFYYKNMEGSGVGGGSADGGGRYWRSIGTNPASGMPIMRYENPDEETTITVHPVSEHFYLIIYGEVRWLKEMFDVEMLIINNSLTDTLEDCEATLTLPEGLSLAAMTDDEQTLSVSVGNVAGGAQKSVHWYVRGDEQGDYSITARLTGTLQPFGETIDRTYQAQDSIHVYAGSAMHLTYYVPDAAYYGTDYVVRAELENVSDKALYNVANLITGIKECKVTHYSDGTVKETVYLEEYGELASTFAQTFLPGDKLVIELSIPIHFESEIIQNQLAAVSDSITQVEKITKALALISEVKDYVENVDGFFSGVDEMMDAGKIAELGPRMKALENGVEMTDTLLENALEKEEAFDAWEALRDVIKTIPVRFDLIRSSVEVLDGSTTEIPTSVVTHHVTGETWIVDIDQYLQHFMLAAFGEYMEVPDTGLWPLDFTLDKLIDVKEAFGYSDSVEYLKGVDGQVQTILAHKPGTDVKVRVWSEHGTLGIQSIGAGGSVNNSVMTINGSSYLRVTPGSQDDTLYVEADGELKTFVFENTEAHTCSGEWAILYHATENTEGAEIKACSTCGKILDTRKTSSCGSHTFSDYEVDLAPTADTLGIETRVCSTCHVLEYRFVSQSGALQSTVSFDPNGGTGEMTAQSMTGGEKLVLPKNGFAHESLQFVCWSTTADGSGECYAPGDEVIITDDAVFYAIWSETGLLTYDLSGVKLSETLLPYNAQEQTVEITGLPEGVSIVNAKGLTGTETGAYTVTAELEGDRFHEAPVLPELTWSIECAIRYEGETQKVYNKSGALNGKFVTLVDAPVFETYTRIEAGEKGTEIITELAEAPIDAGTYRVTAEITFGEPAYTETVTVDYEIIPTDVTIKPNGYVHEYDGLEPVNDNYYVAWGNMYDICVDVEITRNGEGILPGLYEGFYSVTVGGVVDENARDVSANYNITCGTGDLEITKRRVQVIADDVSFVYDGTMQSSDAYSTWNLLAGAEFEGVVISGEGCETGLYKNWLIPEDGHVVDAQGNDLMHLYEVEYIPGSMTITPRPVEIVANEVIHEYDATLVENPGYTVDNLAEGQTLQSIEITGGQTLPGSYPAEFIPHSAVIVDADGNDVTTNYSINYVASDLTIEKRRVTVTADDQTLVYDGDIHQGTAATADRLLEGHALTELVFEVSAIADAGVWTDAIVVADAKVVDAEGNDLMHLYELTYAPGTLTIEPRPVTVTAGNKTWEYDGTAVTNDQYTVENLVESHAVSTLLIAGEATLPGFYEGIFEPLKIMIADGETDVTHNYDITCVNGNLTIEKRKLTVQTSDVVSVYDGNVKAGHGATGDRLLPGHVIGDCAISFSPVDGDGMSVGVYPDSLLCTSVTLLDENGEIVTDLYDITYLPGTMTIEPCPLTITANPATHEYDGMAAVNAGITVDGVVEGQTVTADIPVTEILPGEYTGALNAQNAKVTDAEGNDTTRNYDITYVPGDLTILPRKLLVTANDAVAEYDGQPHGGESVTADRLLEGHAVMKPVITGEAINAGAYDELLTVESILLMDENGMDILDRYDVAFAPGTLTITQRPLTVTAGSVQHEYDGCEATAAEITSSGEIEGHTVTALTVSTETLPGEYIGGMMPAKVQVTGSDGTDETNNYSITCVAGDLTIEKRQMTITAADRTVIYDGGGHTGRAFETERLLTGHKAQILTWYVSTGSTAGVHKDDLRIGELLIQDTKGNDVTAYYEIEKVAGTLTIEPRTLYVTTESLTHEYDGQTVGCPGFTTTNLADEDQLMELVIDGAQSLPGDYEGIFVPASATVTNWTGEDVSDSYVIKATCGSLTIQPRALTITVDDVTVTFDGEVHQAEGYSADRLVEGDQIITVEKSGGEYLPGTFKDALTLSGAVVHNANGEDVTACYSITYVPGTLQIEGTLVEEISLSAEQVHLSVNEGVQLVAEVTPANASIPEVTWHSSDESIVSVTADGVVTRHAEGAVTLTVSAKDGSGVKAECMILDDNLRWLVMPAALTTIEEEAWLGNIAMEAMDLSHIHAPKICAKAFKDCTNLKKVLLPEGAALAADAFEGCAQAVLYVADDAGVEYAKANNLSYVLVLNQAGAEGTELPVESR